MMDLSEYLKCIEKIKHDFISNREDKTCLPVCTQFYQAFVNHVTNKQVTTSAALTSLAETLKLYAELRPQIPAELTWDQLGHVIFIETARVVLGLDFQKLDDADSQSPKAIFKRVLGEAHISLQDQPTGEFLMVLQWLVVNGWSHPILQDMMKGAEIEDSKAQAFLRTGEYPEIFRLRVDMLMENGCDDFALNLANWCTKSPVFENDAYIRQAQLQLLIKLNRQEEFHTTCWQIWQTQCCMSLRILQAILSKGREDDKRPLLTLTQTFLVHDWMSPDKYCCTEPLLKFWLSLEREREPKPEEFIQSVSKMDQLSTCPRQTQILIKAIVSQFPGEFLQFNMECMLKALRLDRNKLDTARIYVKDDAETDQAADSLAKSCLIIASMFKNIPRAKLKADLTAFYLDPSEEMYHDIKKEVLANPPPPSTTIRTSSTSIASGDEEEDEEKKEENPIVPPSDVDRHTFFELLHAVDTLSPNSLSTRLQWPELQKHLRSSLEEAGFTYNARKDNFITFDEKMARKRKALERIQRRKSQASTSLDRRDSTDVPIDLKKLELTDSEKKDNSHSGENSRQSELENPRIVDPRIPEETSTDVIGDTDLVESKDVSMPLLDITLDELQQVLDNSSQSKTLSINQGCDVSRSATIDDFMPGNEPSEDLMLNSIKEFLKEGDMEMQGMSNSTSAHEKGEKVDSTERSDNEQKLNRAGDKAKMQKIQLNDLMVFKCKYCGKVYDSMRQRRRHQEWLCKFKINSAAGEKDIAAQAKEKERPKATKEESLFHVDDYGNYVCELCQRVFVHIQALKLHQRRTHNLPKKQSVVQGLKECSVKLDRLEDTPVPKMLKREPSPEKGKGKEGISKLLSKKYSTNFFLNSLGTKQHDKANKGSTVKKKSHKKENKKKIKEFVPSTDDETSSGTDEYELVSTIDTDINMGDANIETFAPSDNTVPVLCDLCGDVCPSYQTMTEHQATCILTPKKSSPSRSFENPDVSAIENAKLALFGKLLEPTDNKDKVSLTEFSSAIMDQNSPIVHAIPYEAYVSTAMSSQSNLISFPLGKSADDIKNSKHNTNLTKSNNKKSAANSKSSTNKSSDLTGKEMKSENVKKKKNPSKKEQDPKVSESRKQATKSTAKCAQKKKKLITVSYRTCLTCNMEFASASSCFQHQSNENHFKGGVGLLTKYKCCDCNEVFNTMKEGDTHLLKHEFPIEKKHPGKQHQKKLPQEPSEAGEEVFNRLMVFCQCCKKGFLSKASLDSHVAQGCVAQMPVSGMMTLQQATVLTTENFVTSLGNILEFSSAQPIDALAYSMDTIVQLPQILTNDVVMMTEPTVLDPLTNAYLPSSSNTLSIDASHITTLAANNEMMPPIVSRHEMGTQVDIDDVSLDELANDMKSLAPDLLDHEGMIDDSELQLDMEPSHPYIVEGDVQVESITFKNVSMLHHRVSVCSVCNMEFAFKKDVLMHWEQSPSCHDPSRRIMEESNYQCIYCGEMFSEPKDCRDHQLSSCLKTAGMKVQQLKNKHFHCQMCKGRYYDRFTVQRHLRFYHKLSQEESESKSREWFPDSFIKNIEEMLKVKKQVKQRSYSPENRDNKKSNKIEIAQVTSSERKSTTPIPMVSVTCSVGKSTLNNSSANPTKSAEPTTKESVSIGTLPKKKKKKSDEENSCDQPVSKAPVEQTPLVNTPRAKTPGTPGPPIVMTPTIVSSCVNPVPLSIQKTILTHSSTSTVHVPELNRTVDVGGLTMSSLARMPPTPDSLRFDSGSCGSPVPTCNISWSSSPGNASSGTPGTPNSLLLQTTIKKKAKKSKRRTPSVDSQSPGRDKKGRGRSPVAPPEYHPCPKCGKVIEDRIALQIHMDFVCGKPIVDGGPAAHELSKSGGADEHLKKRKNSPNSSINGTQDTMDSRSIFSDDGSMSSASAVNTPCPQPDRENCSEQSGICNSGSQDLSNNRPVRIQPQIIKCFHCGVLCAGIYGLNTHLCPGKIQSQVVGVQGKVGMQTTSSTSELIKPDINVVSPMQQLTQADVAATLLSIASPPYTEQPQEMIPQQLVIQNLMQPDLLPIHRESIAQSTVNSQASVQSGGVRSVMKVEAIVQSDPYQSAIQTKKTVQSLVQTEEAVQLDRDQSVMKTEHFVQSLAQTPSVVQIREIVLCDQKQSILRREGTIQFDNVAPEVQTIVSSDSLPSTIHTDLPARSDPINFVVPMTSSDAIQSDYAHTQMQAEIVVQSHIVNSAIQNEDPVQFDSRQFAVPSGDDVNLESVQSEYHSPSQTLPALEKPQKKPEQTISGNSEKDVDEDVRSESMENQKTYMVQSCHDSMRDKTVVQKNNVDQDLSAQVKVEKPQPIDKQQFVASSSISNSIDGIISKIVSLPKDTIKNELFQAPVKNESDDDRDMNEDRNMIFVETEPPLTKNDQEFFSQDSSKPSTVGERHPEIVHSDADRTNVDGNCSEIVQSSPGPKTKDTSHSFLPGFADDRDNYWNEDEVELLELTSEDETPTVSRDDGSSTAVQSQKIASADDTSCHEVLLLEEETCLEVQLSRNTDQLESETIADKFIQEKGNAGTTDNLVVAKEKNVDQKQSKEDTVDSEDLSSNEDQDSEENPVRITRRMQQRKEYEAWEKEKARSKQLSDDKQTDVKLDPEVNVKSNPACNQEILLYSLKSQLTPSEHDVRHSASLDDESHDSVSITVEYNADGKCSSLITETSGPDEITETTTTDLKWDPKREYLEECDKAQADLVSPINILIKSEPSEACMDTVERVDITSELRDVGKEVVTKCMDISKRRSSRSSQFSQASDQSQKDIPKAGKTSHTEECDLTSKEHTSHMADECDSSSAEVLIALVDKADLPPTEVAIVSAHKRDKTLPAADTVLNSTDKGGSQTMRNDKNKAKKLPAKKKSDKSLKPMPISPIETPAIHFHTAVAKALKAWSKPNNSTQKDHKLSTDKSKSLDLLLGRKKSYVETSKTLTTSCIETKTSKSLSKISTPPVRQELPKLSSKPGDTIKQPTNFLLPEQVESSTPHRVITLMQRNPELKSSIQNRPEPQSKSEAMPSTSPVQSCQPFTVKWRTYGPKPEEVNIDIPFMTEGIKDKSPRERESIKHASNQSINPVNEDDKQEKKRKLEETKLEIIATSDMKQDQSKKSKCSETTITKMDEANTVSKSEGRNSSNDSLADYDEYHKELQKLVVVDVDSWDSKQSAPEVCIGRVDFMEYHKELHSFVKEEGIELNLTDVADASHILDDKQDAKHSPGSVSVGDVGDAGCLSDVHYTCQFCDTDTSFKMECSLTSHLKCVHGVSREESTESLDLCCPICKGLPAFDELLLLIYHMRVVHGIANYDVRNGGSSQSTSPSSGSRKSCSPPENRFASKLVNQPEIKLAESDPFSDVESTCSDVSNITGIANIESGIPLQKDFVGNNAQLAAKVFSTRRICPHCSAAFLKMEHYKTHVLRFHTSQMNNPQWRCSICQTLFTDCAEWRRHMKTHFPSPAKSRVLTDQDKKVLNNAIQWQQYSQPTSSAASTTKFTETVPRSATTTTKWESLLQDDSRNLEKNAKTYARTNKDKSQRLFTIKGSQNSNRVENSNVETSIDSKEVDDTNIMEPLTVCIPGDDEKCTSSTRSSTSYNSNSSRMTPNSTGSGGASSVISSSSNVQTRSSRITTKRRCSYDSNHSCGSAKHSRAVLNPVDGQTDTTVSEPCRALPCTNKENSSQLKGSRTVASPKRAAISGKKSHNTRSKSHGANWKLPWEHYLRKSLKKQVSSNKKSLTIKRSSPDNKDSGNKSRKQLVKSHTPSAKERIQIRMTPIKSKTPSRRNSSDSQGSSLTSAGRKRLSSISSINSDAASSHRRRKTDGDLALEAARMGLGDSLSPSTRISTRNIVAEAVRGMALHTRRAEHVAAFKQKQLRKAVAKQKK